jgi:hypothetical protein
MRFIFEKEHSGVGERCEKGGVRSLGKKERGGREGVAYTNKL